MQFIDNDIRRQHIRLCEFEPLINGTDPHGRTLSLEGGKLIAGHEMFIDYCLSGCKIPDIFLDGSSKKWSIILGIDVLFTLFEFFNDRITTSDNERISDLKFYLRNKFQWLPLEMNVINPGAKDRLKIIRIIQESYGQNNNSQ